MIHVHHAPTDTATMAGVPAAEDPKRLAYLKAMRLVQPEAWVAMVKAAMLEAKGHVTDAAEILGISERQLYRWMKEEKHGLLSGVERAPRGRPFGATDSTPRRRRAKAP